MKCLKISKRASAQDIIVSNLNGILSYLLRITFRLDNVDILNRKVDFCTLLSDLLSYEEQFLPLFSSEQHFYLPPQKKHI